MDWERKLQISNIVTAHQLNYISIEEAEKRMKEVFRIYGTDSTNAQTNYKLN